MGKSDHRLGPPAVSAAMHLDAGRVRYASLLFADQLSDLGTNSLSYGVAGYRLPSTRLCAPYRSEYLRFQTMDARWANSGSAVQLGHLRTHHFFCELSRRGPT